MAKNAGSDPHAAARKYAGRNEAPPVQYGTTVPNMPSIRPFVTHPNGRSFKDIWVNNPGGAAKEKG